MEKITKENAEHYLWGKNCDGWKYLDKPDLSIISEKMPPKTAELSHYHKISNQFFYITKGIAKLKLNHNEYVLNENEGIEIGNYSIHSIENCDENRDLEFLLVSKPKAHGDRVNVDYEIRKALPNEADQLTKLAFISKASWGYPKEWMEAWRSELTITNNTIEKSITMVAALKEEIIGFWCRSKVNSENISIGLLFIHPNFMGKCIGKNLWQALSSELILNGIESFTIEADPNAVPFYLKLGAVKIGEKESKTIAGRIIPILRFELKK